MDYELPSLIEKNKNDENYFIIPILIEKCAWKENKLLQDLQLINSESTTLKDLKGKQYTVLIEEVSRYITDYLFEIKNKQKSYRNLKRKKFLRRLIFSIFTVSLISFFYLFSNSNPFINSPDGIKVDIESLSEEDRQKLIQQLVNEEDDSLVLDTGEVVEENSIQDILKIIKPESCYSSSPTDKSSENFSDCNNLTNLSNSGYGWVSAEGCEEQYINFFWEEPKYIEFITIENFENDNQFIKYNSIKQFAITFGYNNPAIIYGELDRQNESSQWQDINILTNQVEFKIGSYHEGETPFCGLQYITFYGRDT